MKFKKLHDVKSLEEFRQLTHRKIDVLFPLEYLQSSTVIACYSDKNKICGGFMIVTRGPFRVLESIPDAARDILEVDQDQTAELTGLWLDQRAVNKRDSALFWMQLYQHALRTPKQYFIYAYNMKYKKLGRIYAHASPDILYRGPTLQLPGMDRPEIESIEIVRKRNIMMAPFTSPSFFLGRILGKRKAITKKATPQRYSQLRERL